VWPALSVAGARVASRAPSPVLFASLSLPARRLGRARFCSPEAPRLRSSLKSFTAGRPISDRPAVAFFSGAPDVVVA
jgi:hypothetical protein